MSLRYEAISDAKAFPSTIASWVQGRGSAGGGRDECRVSLPAAPPRPDPGTAMMGRRAPAGAGRTRRLRTLLDAWAMQELVKEIEGCEDG